MSQSLLAQIEQLEKAIAGLETQRTTLGESVVETSLAPLRQRLDELLRQRQATEIQTPQAPEEQRKLVSVLCADLAGFTALSTELDPEELHEIQQAYFEAVTPAILRRGGRVEKYIGDAVLAVFGLPQAHEDDPERAVRAALEMQSALEGLNQEKEGELGFPLHMRVGVSTGMVLATMKGGEDFVVTGETVNLASRMQSLSPQGGVLIPQETYRHLRGAFDVSPVEAVDVKGFTEPVATYQVLRAKPRSCRTTQRGVEGIETPLVGRQAELKILQDAMQGAIEEHEGQVLTIRGDAGVGKSRLLEEFQNWIELLPVSVRFFQGKARQEAQGLPYGLLRDLFAFRFQVLDDDPVEKVRQKLETGFEEVFGDREEGVMRSHFLGQMLGYDFSLSPHLERVIGDAEQLRNRGLVYLVEYFKAQCERGTVIVLLEDLHWADDSSLDAVNKLGEQAHHLGLLLVGAARRTLLERRPFWGEGLGYHHFIDLQPLSKRESRQLVGEILKLVEHIPPELRELVVEGGEGNPFYIEELVKMLVESGVIVKEDERWQVETQRLEQLQVPPTLAGVLQARLDSLPVKERIVLQQASVVGRLFWDQVVAYIHSAEGGEDEPLLVPEALTALRGRELVYRREESAFVDSIEYLFKHDILREVTYESVLKRRRKDYHALAADWLIEHCGERIGEYRGLIADHLLLGGRSEQAFDYLQAAGETALAAFANTEAEVYCRRALELSTDDSQTAVILAGLGEALRRQAKHEEGQIIHRRGIELHYRLGNLDKVAYLYASLSALLWRIDYLQAWETCQEGLEVLEGAPDSRGLALLLAEAGRTAYFRSEPTAVVEALCQRAGTMAEQLGEASVQIEALITLVFLSKDISKSFQMMEKAVELGDALGTFSTAGRAHAHLGYLYYSYFIDLTAAFREMTRAAEIARQSGEIDRMFFCLFLVGYCLVEQGELNYSLELMADFLRQSTALPEQNVEFLLYGSSYLMFSRGEWLPAMEFARSDLEKRRKGGELQEIAIMNLNLVSAALDINNFVEPTDLLEAEAALLENFEVAWQVDESRFLLVVVLARQGRLAEAHASLAEALETISLLENNRAKINRLEAEAELALAERHWDQAVSAFQSRIEIFSTAGFRRQWARDLIRLGDALRGRGEPDDLQRSRQTYHQSLEMFTEMGAQGYIEVVRRRLEEV